MGTSKPAATTSQPTKTLAEFLESTPPGVGEEVSDACGRESSQYHHRVLLEPDLQLHCPNDTCQGIRFFRCTSGTIYLNDKDWKYAYMTYVCRNCQNTQKTYAVAVQPKDSVSGVGNAYKFGELPTFGPPTPARVITLIGPDREVYLRGRRAE